VQRRIPSTLKDKGKTIIWEEANGKDEAPAVDREWVHSDRKVAIARVLLDAGSPMTPGEIALRLGQDQSNVRKVADQMADEGILLRHVPPKRESGRGRQPRSAYSLALAEVAQLEEHLESEQRRGIGVLRKGLQILLVGVEQGREIDFLEIVAEVGREVRPPWAGTIDGDEQRYLLAFEGEDSFERAERLSFLLGSADIPCSRLSVTDLLTGGDLIERAGEVLQRSKELADKRASREASWH